MLGEGASPWFYKGTKLPFDLARIVTIGVALPNLSVFAMNEQFRSLTHGKFPTFSDRFSLRGEHKRGFLHPFCLNCPTL